MNDANRKMNINGTEIIISGFDDMSEAEAEHYLAYAREAAKDGETVTKLEISKDNDGQVNLDYTLRPPKFERIRRITGYLVGSIDRWNNAKRAEEHDRVKHGITV